MSSDIDLRNKARELVLANKLPGRRPDYLWGGVGFESRCALCETAVTPEQLAFEVEFDRNNGGARVQHFHLACFSAFEFTLLKSANPPSSEGAAPFAPGYPDPREAV